MVCTERTALYTERSKVGPDSSRRPSGVVPPCLLQLLQQGTVYVYLLDIKAT